MRPALLSVAILSAGVFTGCGPTTFSCEGLDADQRDSAMRTCVFAADIADGAFIAYGDEPAAVDFGGARLTPDARPSPGASQIADDGTVLRSRDGVAIWERGAVGDAPIRRDSLGPIGGTALSPAGRWALALADGRLLFGEPGRLAHAQAEITGGMTRIGTVAATGEAAFEMATPLPIAFSPDGVRLVGAGSDGTLAVWDAGSGERLWDAPLGATVRTVAFSPDGARVAASTDTTAGVWDAVSGAPVGAWATPRRAEAFSFDGEHVAMWFPTSQTNQLRHNSYAARDEHYVRTRSDGSIETISTNPSAVVVWRLP